MSEQKLDHSSLGITNEAPNYGAQGTFNAPVHIDIYNSPPVVSRGDRETILKRVRRDWIEGILLDRSLKGATFIPLGLYERPDLIENRWISVVQEAERLERPLPAGTSIIQVYDEADGVLLILGEPGSGKTTLLLHLARELLDRASLKETHRMPVVFNLSTWTEKRQPLSEWLIGELSTRYGIPPKIGKPCVEQGQILPLLDGLDEVAEEYRAACVSVINDYQQKQQGQVPLVIGSRLAEYTAQATKVVGRKAVFVQSLTLEQIQEYLEKAEGQFGALQGMLHDDPGLQELAKNPLMLSILKETYQGKPAQIVRNASLEERRQQIFADYVKHVFKRRSGKTRYSVDWTKDWLIWLAKQMRQHKQTVFYLERLQLDWLANIRLGELSTSIASGLLSFPVAASVYGLEYSIYGLQFAVVNGIWAGLLTALIGFFFVWFIEADIRVGTLFPRKSRKNPIIRERKSSRLSTFLIELLGERAGLALLGGLLEGFMVQLLVGSFYSLVNGLFLAAFLVMLGKFKREIQPAEKLVWSWQSVWNNAVGSLLIGVGFGVLGGIFDAYPYVQQVSVFLTTLYFWLSLGFALGLIIMLMRGFTSDILDTKQVIKPNQGIRNSLSNSLRFGLSSGTLLGLVCFFFYSFIIHNVFRVGYLNQLPQNVDIIYGVGDAVAVAYLFWLINGGFACIQHFMLRVCLWQTKCTPWRYPRFLDYAHERILLSKVGGGYVFIHTLLLDYFANLDREAGSREPLAESRQPEIMPPTSAKSSDDEQESDSRIFVPVLSEVPRLLPCGHEQRDPHARVCSICGRPVPPESLDQ
jgi:eukaryotic-like serine/threonine-protein kinase